MRTMVNIETGWKEISGANTILLVASHNYPHVRNANLKPADVGTGKIVEKYCSEFNCWGLISSKVQLDPNWYANSPFREMVKEIIDKRQVTVVLDIHGRKIDCKNLIEFFPNNSFGKRKCLADLVVKEFVDNEQLTIVEDLDNYKVPGVEIEIRKDGRVKAINASNYSKAQVILRDVLTGLL